MSPSHLRKKEVGLMMKNKSNHELLIYLGMIKAMICSDRITTFGIRSIRSPAKVGLVITKLLTTRPVVSWRGWETTPPQHHGSTVIPCSTTVELRPLSPWCPAFVVCYFVYVDGGLVSLRLST